MVSWHAIRRVIREELHPIRSKLKAVVRRGVLRSSKPGQGVQTAQIATLADTVRDDAELMEPYGYTSAPPVGSEGVVLHPMGDTSHPLALGFGSRAVRPTELETGDVRMYSLGQSFLQISADGSVELTTAAGATITIDVAGAVTIEGVGAVAIGPGAQQAVARATDPVSIPSLEVLQDAISGWTPAPNDGGAALKTALAAWLGAPVNDGSIAAGGTGATAS